MNKIPVVAVVGPTASGKTSLAIALAKRFGGEVVSADSMQIYKGMDIATAKPSPEEMDGIVHRMMDFLSPDEEYSVAKYCDDANREIDGVVAAGHLPIICGGTGLYVDSLLGNMEFTPEENTFSVRDELTRRCENEGAEVLLEELRQIDPGYAATLHVNNKIRIVRALEIWKTTGEIPSVIRAKALTKESRFDVLYIGLDYKDRQKLYDRCDLRVDIMVNCGLVEEAEKYIGNCGTTSAQAIGYKELAPYFRGECSLTEALSNLKASTRHYAKRQLTWFRKNKQIHWFFPDEEGTDGVVSGASELISEFLQREREE